MLWLRFNFPDRRLWLRKQNPKEVLGDSGRMTTTSFQDVGAVFEFGDIPLKRLVSATVKKFDIKLKKPWGYRKWLLAREQSSWEGGTYLHWWGVRCNPR